jgi:hypothetical protein
MRRALRVEVVGGGPVRQQGEDDLDEQDGL